MACDACKYAFSTDEVYKNIDGHDYHCECVRCAKCSGIIDAQFIRGEHGEFYCVPCGTPICARCHRDIWSVEVLKTQGKTFHVECFSCSECHRRLLGKYYGDDRHPKCAQCELPRCGLCRKIVDAGTRYYILPDGRSMCSTCQGSSDTYPTIASPREYPLTLGVPSPDIQVTADAARSMHRYPVELPLTPPPLNRTILSPRLGKPGTKVTPAAQMPSPPEQRPSYTYTGRTYNAPRHYPREPPNRDASN